MSQPPPRKADAKVEGRDEQIKNEHSLAAFKNLARQLVGVPKDELLKAEAKWKLYNRKLTDV